MERVRDNARNGSGTWRHSRSDEYFIYCVGQDLITINAFMTWALHNHIGIKPLVGMYQGRSERSFISNWKHLPDIRPWLKKEESILKLHRHDARDIPQATLMYLDCDRQHELGCLVTVSHDEALACDSWTYDPLGERYFITR
jgi:hypothetical protein